MKKSVFLLFPLLMSLSSCQKEEKETTYDEALSMLKKIDREINTPLLRIFQRATL